MRTCNFYPYAERGTAIDIAKAQLWEEAKGKLRALVAVAGQCYGSSMPGYGERYENLNTAVEAFIDDIEGKALQE